MGAETQRSPAADRAAAVTCSLATTSDTENSATVSTRQPRRCDICGIEAAVWGQGIARCADHFDFDHHASPASRSPLPRARVLELFARARAAGRLRP
jgi:hypothetical protein